MTMQATTSKARTLIVERSPSDEITIGNCVALDEAVWKTVDYVRLNNSYDFKVVKTAKISATSIGIGGLQRDWVGATEGSKISCVPVPRSSYDVSHELYQLVVELSFYPRDPKKVPPPYDADQLADQFIRTYSEVPFTLGQVFLILPHESKQYLRGRVVSVIGSSVRQSSGKKLQGEAGILMKTTRVKFEKLETSILHLTGSARGSSTQVAIFSPDWDFSKMGIGGLDKEFSTIFRRAFASRVFSAEAVEKIGCKHVRGMLLYGPPGTGKTLMARQIGKMLNAREPIVINGPEILNKFVGESELNIRKLFVKAEEEQKKLGSASGLHIIIFDEIDAICKQRGTVGGGTGVHDTVVNQLLSKLDGVEQLNNILLIGMTNRRDLIDEALLRPGRLEVQVEIGLPDKEGRLKILEIHTSHMRENKKLDPSVDLMDLAERTRNYTGAEIEGLVKSAANTAMNKLIKFEGGIKVDKDAVEKVMVTNEDFEQALVDVKPSLGVSNEQLGTYIRNGIVDWGPEVEGILEHGRRAIKQINNDQLTSITSLLIHGKKGSGKTAIAAQIAQDCKYPFVKFVTSDQMVAYSDTAKCQAIIKVFDDAYKSPVSCIVVDNIEQLLDYNSIGPRFSNPVVQTLKVLFEKQPARDHKLLVIGTSSNRLVMKEMGLADCFHHEVEVPYLTKPGQVMSVLQELKCFKPEQIKHLKKALDPLRIYIGIKKLITIVGAAKQATDDKSMESAFIQMLERECSNKNY